mmetsp:Transcript_147149/g.256848  ORF Transcript_147149/g.256848 Transcript_147149/m.256848 type:complete len:365 (+) Transcript_147149:95-1189(+)
MSQVQSDQHGEVNTNMFAYKMPRLGSKGLSHEINQEDAPGWIASAKIDQFLSETIKFATAVDGSQASLKGFEYVVSGLMQADRDSTCIVVHLFEDAEEDLHPAWRRNCIESHCDTMCISNLMPSRYRMRFVPKRLGSTVGRQLVDEISACSADFVCMGICGRKGSKSAHPLLASRIMEVLKHGACSCIVMNTAEERELPLHRPARFVVSASLNIASTKGFLDALRLSKPGDEIHVVQAKSYLEHQESNSACSLREKYDALIAGLTRDASDGCKQLTKFGDRSASFWNVDQLPGESVSQAVVRYCEEIDADFIVVGANAGRMGQGEEPLDAVSMRICMETTRNFIVSVYTPDFRPGSRKLTRGGC